MIKLLHITVHFEYSEVIENILDRNGIEHYARLPMVEGKDRDGKHFGSQVYPGNLTIYQARTPADTLPAIMKDLRTFRDSKRAHNHLAAIVLPIDEIL